MHAIQDNERPLDIDNILLVNVWIFLCKKNLGGMQLFITSSFCSPVSVSCSYFWFILRLYETYVATFRLKAYPSTQIEVALVQSIVHSSWYIQVLSLSQITQVPDKLRKVSLNDRQILAILTSSASASETIVAIVFRISISSSYGHDTALITASLSRFFPEFLPEVTASWPTSQLSLRSQCWCWSKQPSP